MSLLRLLTAGKSLVGLKKSETRYHLPGKRALPKFGSKKNPFRATALPEQVEPVRERKSEPQGNPSVSGNEEMAQDPPQSLSGAETAHSPTGFTGAGKNDTDADCCGQGKPLERAERRSSPVKAFLLWGRAKKAKRTGAARGTPLVQGELSLDSVKVVRNDLSESDLEIVHRTGRPTAPQRPEQDTQAETKPSALDLGWGAAAGRLFGIGKM
jgi:hypothetical protein